MLRTRIFWAIVLGIVSAALIFEARTRLVLGAVGGKILHALAAPGARLVVLLNQSGFVLSGWGRLMAGLAVACNFLVYLFFWYACIWLVGYFRGRRHPYEHESTLVPPSFR